MNYRRVHSRVAELRQMLSAYLGGRQDKAFVSEIEGLVIEGFQDDLAGRDHGEETLLGAGPGPIEEQPRGSNIVGQLDRRNRFQGRGQATRRSRADLEPIRLACGGP
jgi:hypothetical protein